ncbi:hypothetical protein K8089_08335 [Aequorivita sp. F47161]|uniref:Uncharacterized protein n=1 Tax=Aequorivita vitellina TaxID=2874475 RepID=A0A9X1U1N7_9FLAO|nr:hypothetical protein [Aequorivita vitellina]MCG2419030.1 hypothetical protein [Aequorivita vitellina]
MKNIFKPARIAFYILMLVTFFIVGLYFAGLIDAGKGQGLAGGAIVVGYGFLFAVIAFIASFFIAHFATHKFIVYANIGLLAVIIIAYGITHYRYVQHQKSKEKKEQFRPKSTTPTSQVEPMGMVTFYKHDGSLPNSVNIQDEENDKLGLGFFKPNFFQYSTLFFYGNVTLEKSITQHNPVDSLPLGRDQFGDFTLIAAPPWLLPEAMNPSFGIFYFNVKSVSREFIEVEVNKKTGQTAYLNKHIGQLLFWPEFLLSTASIEFLEGKSQTPKIKPLDYAAEVHTPFLKMKPLQVKDEWIQVVLKNQNFQEVDKGWIRWKRDNKLLIKFELPNISTP